MSALDVEEAVRRVAARRPDLAAHVEAAADSLTAGEGTGMIHQAAVQQVLWWHLPRRSSPQDCEVLVEAAGELLDELGMGRLAAIAKSDQTRSVLDAWTQGREDGRRAFLAAQAASGVEPPDTPVLAWGAVMGVDELRAREKVERALADAVARDQLVPGKAGWRSAAVKLTEEVLTRPLHIPPGQTLAGLVTTERVGAWIDAVRHPLHQEWRSSAANRILNPVPPPADPAGVVAPMIWLLQLAAQPAGAELTQSHYLARRDVLTAVERFRWWDWSKPPHSEADVHQLGTLRAAAGRLGLVRRRSRRLHATTRGAELLAVPAALWALVATQTEEDEEFTRAVTEVVALRLLRGRVDIGELRDEITPMLVMQGWSTSNGPITVDQVSSAIWRPLRWWRIFGLVDEEESKWEYGTGRRLSPHTVAFTHDGERTALAFLRHRAAGPRQQPFS